MSKIPELVLPKGAAKNSRILAKFLDEQRITPDRDGKGGKLVCDGKRVNLPDFQMDWRPSPVDSHLYFQYLTNWRVQVVYNYDGDGKWLG